MQEKILLLWIQAELSSC